MDEIENTPVSSPSEDDDGLFYFESDHLALKGNRDYSEMLKTLVFLEVQYSKAVQDYEKIMEIQNEALEKPNLFYKKLMAGVDLGLPDFQVIVELPNIDWSKYPVEFPAEILQFLNSQPIEQNTTPDPVLKPELETNLDSTHKKTWTVEEQRRLEELLVIYPPEAIELRRYKKIAAALGNRTVKQVTSRVQKYFLKLYKAGLPIPGRIPKNAEKSKKSKLHTHQRFNHLFFKPTTFFPQLDIPVVMNESEVVPGPSTDVSCSVDTTCNNYLLPNVSERVKPAPVVQIPRSDTDLQIEILKKVKLVKEKESFYDYPIQHIGYQCNYCGEDPIYGTRWHCAVCTSESIDFCSDCVVGQMYSADPHPLSHQIEPYLEHTKVDSNSSSESTSKDNTDSRRRDSDSNGGSSCSSNESTDNNGDSDDVQSITNEIEEHTEYVQDDSVDTDEQIEQLVNFEPTSGDSSVTTDTTTDYYSWLYNSQNSEFSDAKDEYNTKKSIRVDNDTFTDAQNLSYSYLHSNLKLDEI